MTKFYGIVGYIETVETEPGIWEPLLTRRSYYGEIVRNTSKFQTSGGVNDNVDISNELSIVADPYALDHFTAMRYVEFMGTKWKIVKVEVKYPRLILSIGGVYNGEQTGITD